MFCPNCGYENPGEGGYCARCGAAVVQFEFAGTALQLFGWMMLTVLASLVIVPLAWVMAAMGRWTARNLRLSDGTTFVFRGSACEVLAWMLGYVFVTGAYMALIFIADPVRQGAAATVLVVLMLMSVMLAINLQIIKWFVGSLEVSGNSRLAFRGGFLGYLGWSLLTGVSIYTIIGWAWAAAGMYRWLARKTEGVGLSFTWKGRGHQVLWRTLVMVPGCLLIVTIPWMVMWLMRWMISQIEMKRERATAVTA